MYIHALLLMEEILHHLGRIKPWKQWGKLPTSTGDRRISEPSRVCIIIFIQFGSFYALFNKFELQAPEP